MRTLNEKQLQHIDRGVRGPEGLFRQEVPRPRHFRVASISLFVTVSPFRQEVVMSQISRRRIHAEGLL